MKCDDIERKLAETENLQDLSATNPDLQEHLQKCSNCSAFLKDLSALRREAQALENFPITQELDQNTLDCCLRQLADRKNDQWHNVPVSIWVIIFLLFGLTLYFILPYFEEIFRGEVLDKVNKYTLLVIIQNTFMLFLSPILIEKFRKKEKQQGRFKVEFNGNNC